MMRDKRMKARATYQQTPSQHSPSLEQQKYQQLIIGSLDRLGKGGDKNNDSRRDIPKCKWTSIFARDLASNQIGGVFLFLEWRTGNFGPTLSFDDRMCMVSVDS